MMKSAAIAVPILGLTLWIGVSQAAEPGSASIKKVAVESLDSSSDLAESSRAGRDLASVEQLYAQLLADYGYRPAVDPLSSFSQGAPALTAESADLALGEARRNMDRLTAAIADLQRALEDQASGTVELEERRGRGLAEITRLADRIRSDFYVRILDQIERGDSDGDLPEALRLGPKTERLRRLADELRRGVNSHLQSDGVLVVSVADLRRPSLEFISRAIRELAEGLRDSKPEYKTGGEAASAAR